MARTRQEHLEWAKRRALEYVDRGELKEAHASMTSDLRKHEELAGHTGIQLGTMMLMSGNLSTPEKMRRFIEGFN